MSLLDDFTEWIHDMLYTGICDNLESSYAAVNDKIAEATGQLSQTPSQFEPGVFGMLQNLSETVIMPIAGILLTYVAVYELIQLVIAHNNLAQLDTWIFFKWIFKTQCAIWLVTNCWTISMAVFDLAGYVVNNAGGVISQSTALSNTDLLALEATIDTYDNGKLVGIYLMTFLLKFLFSIFGIIIWIIVYGRMIEIYLTVSLAPVPFATFGNRELGQIGHQYLRSLFALGFQGFLIMVCIAIYAVLIQNIQYTSDVVASLWGVMGYTILLAFMLFKTGTIAQRIVGAH